jgi:hypothetical protein
MKKIFTLPALLPAFQGVYARAGEPEKILMKPLFIKDTIIGHDARYPNQAESNFNAQDLNTTSYLAMIRE